MPREPVNAYRSAADIIDAALRRHVPVLTLTEAARRAGISPAGWRKVISTGRGRESTLMAMARVTGAEDEVREALGLPPLAGRLPELSEMSAEERRAVLALIHGMRAADGERRGA